MWVVVSYDVTTDTKEGRRRLRRVAQVCKNYGQRVQKSVFECSVNEMQYEELIRKLLKEFDETEDSLRFYRIHEPRDSHVLEFGVNRTIDFNDPMVL